MQYSSVALEFQIWHRRGDEVATPRSALQRFGIFVQREKKEEEEEEHNRP